MPRRSDDVLKLMQGGTSDGAVDLREVMARKRPPGTVHTTDFQNCQSELICQVDPDGTVTGYRLQIRDPIERHIYNFDFETRIRDGWKEGLNELPDVGTKIEPDHPVMQ